MIEPTPIPIETCLTFEDAKPDPVIFNRYHFKLPGEWRTATTNERIIGVRSIYLAKLSTTLKWGLRIRKYLKSKFKSACESIFDSEKLNNFDYNNPSSEDIDIGITKMKNMQFPHPSGTGTVNGTEYISEILVPFRYDLLVDSYLYDMRQTMFQCVKEAVDDFNSKMTSDSIKPTFNLDRIANTVNDIIVGFIHDDNVNDYQMLIHSPCNNAENESYYVDFRFDFINDGFMSAMNLVDDGNINSNPNFTVIDKADYPHSNYTSDIMKWSRTHKLIHLWDRSSCKVFSSLASQSNHNYLGHCNIHFNPIKYFIIRNTDDSFYIDFFFGRRLKTPVKIPKEVSFFIELQLMQHRKLLYI